MREPLHPVPWRQVGVPLVVGAVLLTLTASRYGFHRDELYFLMLEPAWGYVDQPPLTPALARAAVSLFNGGLAALRIPATLMLVLAVVFAVYTTRELGGGRRAQILCAWGLTFAAIPLAFSHTMLTATVDLAVWSAALLLMTRALIRDQPRWWLAVGTVVGVGLLNKHLIVLLLLCVLIGLLVFGPRGVLRSGWLWAGVVLALVISLPNLIYQATNDWPQLTMARALADRGGGEARALLIPLQFVLLGPGLLPVWAAGLVSLLRRAEWRPVRALGAAYPLMLVVCLVTAGQFYYTLGLVVFLFAAGCVSLDGWMRRTSRVALAVGVLALNIVVSIAIALPIIPLDRLGATPIPDINQVTRDSVGWEEYVEILAGVYESLPEADRAVAVLYTSNYGEAGALSRFGGAHGLPEVYSGHNQLWFYGPPPADARVVVAWTQNPTGLARFFGSCESHAVMDNGYRVDNEEQGSVVAVCRDPIGGWDNVWPELQHYS